MDEVKELLAKADEIAEKQETETPPEPPAPPKIEYPQQCPVCYHRLDQPVVKADENELREYMRCILGNKPFTKTYTIGEGAIAGGQKWTLGVLTCTQSEQMDALLDKVIEKEKQARQRLNVIQQVKLMFYLRSIGDTEYTPLDPSITEVPDVEEAYNGRFGEMSEVIPTLGVRCVVLFEQLIAVLTQSVFDESFWKGAGLV